MTEQNQLIVFTKWVFKWVAILCGGLIGLAIIAIACLWCNNYFTYELPKSQIHITVSSSKACMFKNEKKVDIPPWEKDWEKTNLSDLPPGFVLEEPSSEEKENIKQEPWANDPIVGVDPWENEPIVYEGLYPVLVKIGNGSNKVLESADIEIQALLSGRSTNILGFQTIKSDYIVKPNKSISICYDIPAPNEYKNIDPLSLEWKGSVSYFNFQE